MDKSIINNHQKYLERMSLYKKFGYDIEEERKFIIEKAQSIYGDVMEVGTGKGYFTLALAREGCNFTSIDISQEEQAFAKLNIKYCGFESQVNFKIADAQKLPFKDNEFDIVFCVNTFHHFENPLKITDELMRVISFEGKIILSDFNKEGLMLVDKIHHREGRSHNTGLFDLDYTARYLLDSGFRLEKSRTDFQEVVVAYHPII
ncbi:MAG: class I SAM-dependent methyltransferase [Candidatus Omnitrophica bacterium]|nr:class I SAM-dependent methyltransferase [Candidatus Omnitrophota bacterium]